MNQKKLKKTIYRLAEMCNATACKNCFLSFDENRCMLKHTSLMDIAKGCFDNGQPYDGTVWIRFDDREAFNSAAEDVKRYMSADGYYNVAIYLRDSNSYSSLQLGLWANNEALKELISTYGEDNVKLVMKVPDEVLSYF